jgi:hypothetical protein
VCLYMYPSNHWYWYLLTSMDHYTWYRTSQIFPM